MKKSGAILAAMVALGLSAISTEARSRTETERGSLSSTGVDDDARGKVKLKVHNSSDGRFDLQVQKLDSSATYDVLADGVLVGRLTTTRKGSGRSGASRSSCWSMAPARCRFRSPTTTCPARGA